MNLQGYSRLSVALLLASIYIAEEVTNSESSRHLPNLTLLLPSSSHLPFPSLSLTLSQPLLLSMWRCECVSVCVVISAVCVRERLWILRSVHKRQQHLRDLSRLSKLNIFHCLWLYVCACLCVRVPLLVHARVVVHLSVHVCGYLPPSALCVLYEI